MKTPKPNSIADKIGRLLHKDEPKTYSELAAAIKERCHHESSTWKTIVHMIDDQQLVQEGDKYRLADPMRKFYEMSAPVAKYKGDIVPPRTAPEFRPIQPKISFGMHCAGKKSAEMLDSRPAELLFRL